ALRADQSGATEAATAAAGAGSRGRSGRSNGHQHRLQRPRLEQHLRVLDGRLVEQLIALAREALEDLHVLGVEEATAREPGLRYESDRLDHERVAFPVADGVTRVLGLARPLGIERAAVGRDHAEVRITAAAVAAVTIEQGDVVVGREDAPRRSLSRLTHRLTGHDRIQPVRPHVVIDDRVPVLGLVERAIRPEARSRLELEIERLIPRRATTLELRGCAPAVAIAPDEKLVAV